MDVDTLLQPPAVTSAPVATSFIVHRKADPLAGQVLADGLRVSAPSDPLEREAEATASRVMRMQAPAKAGRAPSGELQRACASCDGKKDKAVHRKPASVQRAPAAIASQGGSGSALPDGVRADMEGRFGGQDFGGVRVHAGPQANTLARAYNARAFTMGSDIYFGQGEYSPSSKGGQHLLAHELTHVVQGGGAEVRRFRLSAGQQRRYPRFKSFVREQMPRTANDRRIVAALNKYGTNRGSTARNIAKDVSWGKGPTLNVVPLSGALGEFLPGSNSSELRIDESIVKAYEQKNGGTGRASHRLLLESTILHEYTHYLDDQDGSDYPGEEGQAFEDAVYGRSVVSLADASSILRADFGSGDWRVQVVKKKAAYKQRFVVRGSAKGNGEYSGVVGKSTSVRGPSRGTWRLSIQNDHGKNKWRNSKIHKVKEGPNSYLVRSEDGRNRDMDDLEIRVKR